MKKILYMHIGISKTGSTSIQQCLYKNNLALKNNNFIYPISFPLSKNHFNLSSEIKRHWNHIDYIENIKNMSKFLEKTNYNVILSSESFIIDDPKIFKNIFFCFDSIYIICYLRNIFSFLSSSLQQVYKEIFHFNGTQVYFSYINSLKNWINYIGLNNCIFKNFDILAKQDILIEDFLQTIGIRDQNDFIFPEKRNMSLKAPYTFFLRHLANVPITPKQWYSCVNFLQFLSKKDGDLSNFSIISPKIWEENYAAIDEQIKFEAQLLQDPSWIEYCYAQKNKLVPYPYTQLPIEQQHKIFEELPQYLKDAIKHSWPKYSEDNNIDTILPPIYYDKITNEIIFRWRRASFEKQYAEDDEKKNKFKQSLHIFNTLYKANLLKKVYTLTSQHGIIFCQHIEHVTFDGQGIHFVSTGNDPICILPNIIIHKDSIYIIQISGSGTSLDWQLFYHTKFNSMHCEEQSIHFSPQISKNQPNGALFLLPFNALGSGLRLDPGNASGTYCIEKLNIYILEEKNKDNES